MFWPPPVLVPLFPCEFIMYMCCGFIFIHSEWFQRHPFITGYVLSVFPLGGTIYPYNVSIGGTIYPYNVIL